MRKRRSDAQPMVRGSLQGDDFLLLQDMSRRNAAELVKAMIFFGYRFKLGFGHTAVDPAEFTSTINPDFVSALRRK